MDKLELKNKQNSSKSKRVMQQIYGSKPEDVGSRRVSRTSDRMYRVFK
jgi:hypothetical protein